jgi:SanA protein
MWREIFAFDRAVRRWLLRGIIIGAHLILLLLAFYFLVSWISQGATYDKMDDLPVRYAGVVMGCVKKVGDFNNEFFTKRVEAAADLYHAGKVRYLIVSGDNHNHGYDEPTDLKAALVAKGVPPEKIYCDYAGLRTLDSVVRAKVIFDQNDYIVISQHFQNERAVYIAKRQGMEDVVAFNAADPKAEFMAKMYLRELFARVRAVLDVEFWHTQPKFLGPRVFMGEKTPPIDAAPGG